MGGGEEGEQQSWENPRWPPWLTLRSSWGRTPPSPTLGREFGAVGQVESGQAWDPPLTRAPLGPSPVAGEARGFGPFADLPKPPCPRTWKDAHGQRRHGQESLS